MTDDQIRADGEKAIRRHMTSADAQRAEQFCVATLKAMFDHIEIASRLACSAELTAIQIALGDYVEGARRALEKNQGE